MMTTRDSGRDPLTGSAWSEPGTVAGFVRSAPNATLMRFAEEERARGARRLLDIGCGAGRNALPLAHAGWDVTAVDLSRPMLLAAAERRRTNPLPGVIRLTFAEMERLPIADRTMDLVVAHGIWNLAASSAQFRAAVREGARVARPGAALFVFTFSRATLAPDALPVPGETIVFTQFSGAPQVFLTATQLTAELHDAGFEPDPRVPLTEHNKPRPGALRAGAR